MAKNCYKCSLPITNEQPFVTCRSCNTFLVHNSCINILTQNVEDGDIEWKCSSCSAKDIAQNLDSSHINSTHAKLNDLHSRITKLHDEQKNLVNSLINACNNTMGDYEETINSVTSMLISLQSQLDEFTDEPIEDVTPNHQEQHGSSK